MQLASQYGVGQIHPVLHAAIDYLNETMRHFDYRYINDNHAVIRHYTKHYKPFNWPKCIYHIIGIQYLDRISIASYTIPHHSEDDWAHYPPITTESDWVNFEFADPESFPKLAKLLSEK